MSERRQRPGSGAGDRPHTLFEVEPGAHDPLADLAQAAGHEIEERLHAQRQLKRRWSAYAFLLLAIAGGVTGTSALSQSHGFTRLQPLVVMALAYLVCFVALTRALRVIPVGIAYAIWSGVGIAAITLIGFAAFGQALNAGELAGIALILVGVVVIQLYSKAKAQ
jgi:small multidrug resistance pump